MDPINKTALRAAVLIHEQLAGGTRHDLPIYLPEYSWNNIQQLRRQIDLARQRGGTGPQRGSPKDLAGALDDCRRELENASAPSNPHHPTPCLLRLRHLPGHFGPLRRVRGSGDRPGRAHAFGHDRSHRAGGHQVRPLRDPAGLAASGRFARLSRRGPRSQPGRQKRRRYPSARPGRAALRGRRPRSHPGRLGRVPLVRFLPAGFPSAPHLRPGQCLRGAGRLGRHPLQDCGDSVGRRRPLLLPTLRQRRFAALCHVLPGLRGTLLLRLHRPVCGLRRRSFVLPAWDMFGVPQAVLR